MTKFDERFPEAKFDKTRINWDGMYLTYYDTNFRSEFLARFKYNGGLVTMGVFKKALLKSGLSPAQYFELLSDRDNSPVSIMTDNGILSLDYDALVSYVDGKEVRRIK